MTDLLIERGAEISTCRRYRYLLWRRWDKSKPHLVFIMLNPSTADGETDDATIRVCMGRATRMGCGGIRVVNLFAYRATAPADMMRADDPVGPENDQAIARALQGGPHMVVAAWGRDGAFQGRYHDVVSLVCGDYGVPIYCLGQTADGMPKHPLRIPYSKEPELWTNRETWLGRVA